METVNRTIAFADKTGTIQFSSLLGGSGGTGFFPGALTVFDPKCLYDQYSGRFVAIGLEHAQQMMGGPDTAHINIAVSDDNDPNGTWYAYRTDAIITVDVATHWVDYPGLGVDAGAIYVTGNLVPTGGGALVGSLYRIFRKLPMLSGLPVNYTDLVSTSSFSVQAAHEFGSPQAPFFVSTDTATSIKIQAIKDPLSTPVLQTAIVSVPFFRYPTSDAPQPCTFLLDVLDGRIINTVWIQGRLYAAHGIKDNGKNVARWYEFKTNDWPNSGAPTLTQSGNIDEGNDQFGSPIHTWFPTIMGNNCGEVGVVLARSSASQNPGIWATGRFASDPPGTMAPLSLVHEATAYGYFRWGDYFGIAIDPLHTNTFWAVGEYATVGCGSAAWGTWISSFTVAPFSGSCP